MNKNPVVQNIQITASNDKTYLTISTVLNVTDKYLVYKKSIDLNAYTM